MWIQMIVKLLLVMFNANMVPETRRCESESGVEKLANRLKAYVPPITALESPDDMSVRENEGC